MSSQWILATKGQPQRKTHGTPKSQMTHFPCRVPIRRLGVSEVVGHVNIPNDVTPGSGLWVTRSPLPPPQLV